MNRIHWKSISRLALVMILTTTGIIAYQAQAQQDDLIGRKAKRSTFMKMKLEYSKNLLEALTTENYDKI